MNKIIIKIVLLLIVLVFFSCSINSNDKDHLVFRYNEHKNISSLDPAFAKDNADIWVVNQLFNGLVEMDKDLNIIPSIAKNWSISDDGKTYAFNLKTNIKFHEHELLNNRKVLAKDFSYSFDRILDKKLASPGAWVLDKVKNYEAVNDSLFKIQLKEPFNAFLGILSMKYCSVVPKEIVEHYGNDFRKNPVGTGPFKFKRWEENIKLVLRKNVHYFEKDEKENSLPYLEAVAITFIPEKQSEFLEFVHDIDISWLPKDELLREELIKIKEKKYIFTNGSHAHVENVTKQLGIDGLFDGAFDIVDANFIPKPKIEPYKKIIEKINLDPAKSIIIEDIAHNLEQDKKLGMKTCWLENDEVFAKKDADKPYIDYKIKNLPSFLQEINILKDK